MNVGERDEFKPECERCGQLITDIDWCDTSTVNEPDLAVPGYMRCSTDGCYNARGSRVTNPIVPGGLTIDDHAWVNRMMRVTHT